MATMMALTTKLRSKCSSLLVLDLNGGGTVSLAPFETSKKEFYEKQLETTEIQKHLALGRIVRQK